MTRDEDTSGIFREVNEQIQNLSTTFGVGLTEHLQIVCECAQPTCSEPIDVTMGEYARIRGEASLFAIKPDHAFPQGGEPRSKNDRYWLVASPTVHHESLPGA